MNVYIKAAIDTVLFVIYVLAIYFGVMYLLNSYGDIGLYTVAGVLAGFCLYLVYSLSLARRKYRETVKSIKEN